MSPVSAAANATVQFGAVFNDEAIGGGFPLTLSADLQGTKQPLLNFGLVGGIVPSWHQVTESVVPEDPQECPPEWMDPTCESTKPSDTKLYEATEKQREWNAPVELLGRWSPNPDATARVNIQAGGLFRSSGVSFVGGLNVDIYLGERGAFVVDALGGKQFAYVAAGLSFKIF